MTSQEISVLPAHRQCPSADTQVEVVLLLDPSDGIARSADLFRSPAFFRLHAASFARAWYALAMDASNGRCLASAWFAETAPGHACSGSCGSFGGFHSPHDPLPIGLASRVIVAAEEELRARDISRITLTLPPLAYEPESQAEWMNVLMRVGYTPAPPDLSFHAVVMDEDLEARMDECTRSVVRTAERKGLFVRELREHEWAYAYEVTAANRVRRGRRMSMTLNALLELDAAIPDTLHWFGVFGGERMIAASVCMRASTTSLHVIALGDVDNTERPHSVPVLVSHLYAWCRDRGIEQLDLGTASESSVPNEEQLAYFRSLGFELSSRFTLEKELQT